LNGAWISTGEEPTPNPSKEGNFLHRRALREIPSWEGQGWVGAKESLAPFGTGFLYNISDPVDQTPLRKVAEDHATYG